MEEFCGIVMGGNVYNDGLHRYLGSKRGFVAPGGDQVHTTLKIKKKRSQTLQTDTLRAPVHSLSKQRSRIELLKNGTFGPWMCIFWKGRTAAENFFRWRPRFFRNLRKS
jgi:hypothetical protein